MPTPVATHFRLNTYRAQPRTLLSLAIAAALGTGAPMPALSQTGDAGATSIQSSQQRQFNIKGGPLDAVLNRFALEAGIDLSVSTDLTRGKTSQGLLGEYSVEQALRTLLADSGLSYRFAGENQVTLVAAQAGRGPIQLDPIKVEAAEASSLVGDPVQGYKADYATTATRSRLSVMETPVSIGIVTGDLMEDTVSRTQGDAMENVSSVSRSNYRLGRSEGMNIRGFQVGSFAGSFNGFKENGLATDGNFAPDPAIIERYEVLKGPASITGGAASPGGVINRITKKPQGRDFTEAQIQAGSFDFKRGVLDTNQVLSEGETVRGRLVAAVEDGGNFVDEVDVRQYTAMPSLELDLFEGRGTLFVSHRFQKFDGSSYDGFPFLKNGERPDISRRENIGGGSDNGAFTDFEGNDSELHYDHEFVDNLELSAKLGYERSELASRDLYAFTFGGADNDGTADIYTGYRESDWETLSGELFFRKGFGADREHEVILGVDHRDQTNEFLNAYQFMGADNIFNPENDFTATPVNQLKANLADNREVTLEQTGLFGQLVYRPVERLTLVAAGRQDWADSSFLNRTSGDRQEGDASSFTGRLGATYALTPSLSVYGGYQESFSPNAFATTVDGDLIEPETGDNQEIGLKVDAFAGRLGGSLSIFRTERQNVATADQDNPGFSIAVGEQRHEGVELDINGEPITGLKIHANASYVDAEVTESNDGFEGFSPQRIPIDYVGRVFATYEFQSGPLQGFGFGGGAFFHSGYHLDMTEDFTSDSYTRYDAVAFYRPREAVEMRLNIRNLTDKVYVEAPGSPHGYNQFGAPFNVMASLKFRF
ncbi:MAG: TonB-dependent siderophore receptor [Alcanivorax sp.]|uniref:TonB-dependent siderophore receptor n=1 Tax=Alcanivorax sp. TaxID=1872427 RepID=UPI003DA7A68C